VIDVGSRARDREALPGPLRAPARPDRGVNLVGFLEAESGLGEVARRLAAILDASDIRLAAIPYRRTLGRQDHSVELALTSEAPFDVNLISLSADDLTKFAADAGGGFFANRYSIGLWFWETNVFSSAERTATRFLDELWVASDYVRVAVAEEVDVPVHVVPVPMDVPREQVRSRSELGLPEGFTFLFVFDFWSGVRKNPSAVVEAFSRAFQPGEGPTLLLKSINGRDWKPRQLEELRTVAGGREDILIRDGYVSARERDSLLACCDCYVSLHRSEGLGLTMAEAMACGKPVIATGYSGNLEFMSEANSYLVPYHLVDIPETWWAHAPGAQWAEPDIDAAASLMRYAWEHADEARELGRRAQDDVLTRFAPERTAAFIEQRLTELRTHGAVTARSSVHDARPAIVDASRTLDATGMGEALVRGSRSRPASFARRVLRRALWPHLAEQRRFETSVVDALTELHRSVDAQERRIARLEERLGLTDAGARSSGEARPDRE
jgi:glycosyltransferase involved in cell wall biosynthesis